MITLTLLDVLILSVATVALQTLISYIRRHIQEKRAQKALQELFQRKALESKAKRYNITMLGGSDGRLQ